MTKMPDRKRTVEQVVSARAAKQQSDFHIDTENRVANLERRGGYGKVMRPLYTIWTYGSDRQTNCLGYKGMAGNGNTVYYSHYDTAGVSAYDINSGERLWFTDLDALGKNSTSWLAATSEFLFASESGGGVYAFNIVDGSLEGELAAVGSDMSRALAVHEDTNLLYVITELSIGDTTGMVWQVDISDPSSMSVIDTTDSMFPATVYNNVDATGLTISQDGSFVYAAYSGYLAPSYFGRIVRIDTSDMSIDWNNTTIDNSDAGALALTSDGATLYSHLYGYLQKIDASTGTVQSTFDLGSPLSGQHYLPQTEEIQCMALIDDRWLGIVDNYDGYLFFVFDIVAEQWVHLFDTYELEADFDAIIALGGKWYINNGEYNQGGIHVFGSVPVAGIDYYTKPDYTADPRWTEAQA